MSRTKSALLTALLLSTVTASAADFQAYDYDPPAYIDLEFSEIRVNETAGTVTINILRTGDFRQTTTIEYKTEEIDASEGQDYGGTGGTITFNPGEMFKSVVVKITADEEEEAEESFHFEISGSSAEVMVNRRVATVVIEDAPMAVSQPELEIASAGDGRIVLSWAGSECALERTSDPAGGSWESVACSPVVSGGRCVVEQPMAGTLYFYRLRVD